VEVQLKADGIMLVINQTWTPVMVRRSKGQVKRLGVRPFHEHDVPAQLGTGGVHMPHILPVSAIICLEHLDGFLRLLFCKVWVANQNQDSRLRSTAAFELSTSL
jgi:hypothetical protein